MPSKSAKSRRPGLREEASARRVAIVAFPGISRRNLARYFRSGAGVRGIAGDRTADGELFAVVSLRLGRVGANRCRDDGRHRADLQRSAARGRYPHHTRRSRHLGAAARRQPDELDFGGAAEVTTDCIGVLGGVRAGLDRRARRKARCDALALLPKAGGQLPQHPCRAECDLRQGRASVVIGRCQRRYRPGAGHDRGGFRPYHRARHRATAGGVSQTSRRPKPVLYRARRASVGRGGTFQRAARLDHREHCQRPQGRNAG